MGWRKHPELIGTGLKSDDEIVTVNFGEAGSQQKGCSIVEVASTMIACRVPDFRNMKVSYEKDVALVIYFSGQMLRSEIDVSANYTFSASSTP